MQTLTQTLKMTKCTLPSKLMDKYDQECRLQLVCGSISGYEAMLAFVSHVNNVSFPLSASGNFIVSCRKCL